MSGDRLRVLFICTGNSARSQMAETILRALSHGHIDVQSAGSDPEADIHPMARQAIRNLLHAEMVGQWPKSLLHFRDDHFNYIISVCNRAVEVCPVFPDDPERIRWTFEDPAGVEGSDAEKQRAFDTVARQLVGRIRIWMCLPRIRAARSCRTGRQRLRNTPVAGSQGGLENLRITAAVAGHADVNSIDVWMPAGTSTRAIGSNPNLGKYRSAVVVNR